jgi:formylglycine-generating enzyme required for sulfatase activity/serine/threonine protein kinase
METFRSVHPADETLISYGLGKLDETVAESVNKHLEQCIPCRLRVAELSCDSFVDRMRKARAGTDKSPPEAQAPKRSKTLVGREPPRHSYAAGKQPSASIPSTSAAPPSELPPELVNHPQYEILRELGRGGMGVVYLARNKLMDRLEVLKVMNRQMLAKQGTAKRFLREIQSAAKLHHPNVVTAYTAIPMGDLLVFAMEYVEGSDLAKLVRIRGSLPVLNACFFIYQAAQGLQHACERGMIHRDIKPGNLILLRQGKKAIVKILDFGLAKITSEGKMDGTLTQQGQMLGTPDYVAPEQMLDAQKADIRADIYSLGCTLYHLLTGHPPFSGNSLYELLQAHHSIDARPLNLVRPEVPVELATLVAKMMAKDANRRYQTPAEVVQALKPFLRPDGLTAAAHAELSQIAPSDQEPALPAAVPLTGEDDEPSFIPMDVVEPSARWKSLLDVPQFQRSSALRSALREPSAPRSGPFGRFTRRWKEGGWIPWSVFAFGLVFAGMLGVIIIHLGKTTIVLNVEDHDLNVAVKGSTIVVAGPRHEELRVNPGEQELTITHGGLTFVTKSFALKKGDSKTVTISIVDKKIVATLENQGLSLVPFRLSAPAVPLVAPFDATAARRGQQQWANRLDTSVERINSIAMKLVLIPPGEFKMGLPASQWKQSYDLIGLASLSDTDKKGMLEAEQPQHRVRITRPFRMGQFEVTLREFTEFVREAGYKTEAERNSKSGDTNGFRSGRFWRMRPIQDMSRPVDAITWNDAVAFCTWLSRKEKKTYRLPSEAEWEYACRAGTEDLFYCGNDPEELTRFENVADATYAASNPGLPCIKSSDGFLGSSPVGQFRPNPFGLHDMLGNVREWCLDWFDENYYAKSPIDDPPGPVGGSERDPKQWEQQFAHERLGLTGDFGLAGNVKGSLRVVRGGDGNFVVGIADNRASTRSYITPTYWNFGLGFRVVREIDATTEPQEDPPKQSRISTGGIPMHPGPVGANLRTGGDPDRQAAEWTHSLGGAITVQSGDLLKEIRAGDQIPAASFTLTRIDVTSKAVRGSDLVRLRDVVHLNALILDNNPVTDEGIVHLKSLANLSELTVR